MTERPAIYLIARCNGAGKTTFALDFLPQAVRCLRFLNADEIARGLSPLAPDAGAFKAGKILLTEVHECIRKQQSFGLESTLSGRTYVRLLRQAKSEGYRIEIHYLFLPNPELALSRIRERVRKGGHDVPAKDVRRRFLRSLDHFIKDYAPLADEWAVWDNQGASSRLIADSGACSLASLRTILLL